MKKKSEEEKVAFKAAREARCGFGSHYDLLQGRDEHEECIVCDVITDILILLNLPHLHYGTSMQYKCCS